jgi:hypothetical protein
MDQLREDTILHNPDYQPSVVVSPRADNANGKMVVISSAVQNISVRPLSSGSVRKPSSFLLKGRRPKSAEQALIKKTSDSTDERIERRKLRLMKEIDRFREEIIKSELEQMKWSEKNEINVLSQPPRSSVSQKGKRLLADIEAGKKDMLQNLHEKVGVQQEEALDWNNMRELEERVPSAHKIPLNTEFIPVHHPLKHQSPLSLSDKRLQRSTLTSFVQEERKSNEQERVIFSRIFDNDHPTVKDERIQDSNLMSVLLAKGKQRPVSASAAIPTRVHHHHHQLSSEVLHSKSHNQRSHSSLGHPVLIRPSSSSVVADQRKSNDSLKEMLESMKITTGENGQIDLIIGGEGRTVESSEETERATENVDEIERKKVDDDEVLRTSFEAIKKQHNQISSLFSYSSLPFLSPAPFLPLAADDQFHQTDEGLVDPMKSTSVSTRDNKGMEAVRSNSKSVSASPSFELLQQEERVITSLQKTVKFVECQVIADKMSGGNSIEISQKPKSKTTINWDELIEKYDASHLAKGNASDCSAEEKQIEAAETLDLEQKKEEEWRVENELVSGLNDSPLNKTIELPPIMTSPLPPPFSNNSMDESGQESSSRLDVHHDDLNIFQLSPDGTGEGEGPFSIPFELSESMLSPVSIFYFESSFGTGIESDYDHSLSREK